MSGSVPAPISRIYTLSLSKTRSRIYSARLTYPALYSLETNSEYAGANRSAPLPSRSRHLISAPITGSSNRSRNTVMDRSRNASFESFFAIS